MFFAEMGLFLALGFEHGFAVNSVFSLVTLSALAFLSGIGSAEEGTVPRSHAFTMSLRSESEMKMVNGREMKVQADHQTDYTWQINGQDRTLILDSLFTRTVKDGKEGEHLRMNRREMVDLSNGKTKTLSVEKGPPEFKEMLRDLFEVPLVTLRYDQEGKEIDRRFTLKPGASDIVDDTVVANSALFHPIVPSGKAEWSADAAMMLGTEGLVKGKLEYRKIQDGENPVFSVKGTLTNDRYAAPDGKVVFRDVRYVVSGEQTYDLQAQKWLSGKLAAAITFSLEFPNGGKLGSGKGSSVSEMKARAKP